MSLLHDPRVFGWLSRRLVCRVDGIADRFALTFDDGPSAANTPRILDVLGRHRARATFFLLAHHVRREPALVRRIRGEGHEAAAHGDLHWPVPLLPAGLFERELARCVTAIADAGGGAARHYRPAFGVMTASQAAAARRRGLTPVLGDVYPEDPHRPGAGRIVERVMRHLRPGSIVILHDGRPFGPADRDQTIAALDVFLTRAAARGLAAVTVAELLASAPRGEAAAASR